MAVTPIVIDPKKASQKEIEEALALLGKKRTTEARIKAGELKGTTSVPYSILKETNPEAYQKARERDKKFAIRTKLLLAKARAAGITVTEAEVDAAMK